MGAERRAIAVPAAVLAAVALTATACSSSSGGASAGSSAAAPPAAAASGSGSAGAPGGTGGTGSASAGAGGGGGQSQSSGATAVRVGTASTRACTSSQLSVVQKDPSVGAGQYYATLVFTNTSAASCTLTGYPGLSYVATNGVQSGNAAARAAGSVGTVTLKPGGTAKATLHDSNGVGGYDPAECQLAPAQGLRIYPPNEQAALFLPWKTDHCAGPTIHALTIGPVEQG